MDNNFSLADIGALPGSKNGGDFFGGTGALVLTIIVILLLCGNGGFGGGCCNRVIALNGNAITLNTAAGALTVTLHQDGVAVSGTVSTATAAAGGSGAAIPMKTAVHMLCGRRGLAISLTLSCGGAAISAWMLPS